MILTLVANFIKLFWHNLQRYWYTALNFDTRYTPWGINYAKKLYEIDFCGQFHKTFFGIIYGDIGVQP